MSKTLSRDLLDTDNVGCFPREVLTPVNTQHLTRGRRRVQKIRQRSSDISRVRAAFQKRSRTLFGIMFSTLAAALQCGARTNGVNPYCRSQRLRACLGSVPTIPSWPTCRS